uniref:Putative proline-rich receptor-like protein kinase perk4 n=1 Tax=Anopheles darlingi TaxID=43151 RepID=A0A2M4CPS4_ANODA
MFRRFSLFDAAPPSSTVSISRPKPPPIPKPQHSASSASSSSSSLAANGCPPGSIPIPELRVPPPRTNPINIAGGGVGGTGTTDSSPDSAALLKRIGSSNGSLSYLQPTPGHSPGSVGSNGSSSATAPNGASGGGGTRGIKLLSSSPAYHRQQSIGSAPTHPTGALQQQVHAAQVYLSSNRNSYVYGPPTVNHGAGSVSPGKPRGPPTAVTARERYSTHRSISSPVAPASQHCLLSSSVPSSIKYYYSSPTWYSRFSHSLRKNVLRRTTSAQAPQNVILTIPTSLRTIAHDLCMALCLIPVYHYYYLGFIVY